MGVIDPANLKWYYPATVAEGDTHGGAISANEITTNVSQNIFDNIPSVERAAGDTSTKIYRKVFLKNLNADDYVTPTWWLSTNTPADNDAIAILLGGTKSEAGVDVAITGTVTFTNESTAVTGVDTLFLTELAPGEKVFIATGNVADAKVVASIESDTALTLATAYGSTPTAGTANVARISESTFAAAASKVAGLMGPTLSQNEYQGVWLKRTITPGVGTGYSGNYFELSVEDA